MNMQVVLELCKIGEFAKALPLLESIVNDDPKNSEAWRLMAQIHWNHMNMPDKAFDELIESLHCNPKNIWALVLLGNLFLKEKKDIIHARKYFEKVIEYDPHNAIAINNIGATYMEIKDYNEALPYLEKALKLDASYINAYYGLALCYYKLSRLEDCFRICNEGALNSVNRPENPKVREELLKLYMIVAGDLVKINNYVDLRYNLKKELESIDKLDIHIVEDYNLSVFAKLEYAPLRAAQKHVIRYNPTQKYIDHLFIHEMIHLKMSQLATISKRGKVVVSSTQNQNAFNNRYLKFMQNKHPNMHKRELDNLMSDLAKGIGLQLMNCPLDLFVEYKIYTEYPVVRPLQMLSLYHMEMNNIKTVQQASQNGFFPKEIVYANKVMNATTSMCFKDMYGINLIHEYHLTNKEYHHAKDLYDEFKAYIDTYKIGDEYEMLEYFVQSFNMDDFLEIIEEDVIVKQHQVDFIIKNELKNLAEDALSKEDVDKANKQFRQNHKDGENDTETMMMSTYMLGAMEYFDTLELRDVHRIALEIAMIGVKGINPMSKYNIKSIPSKEFSGYEFLSYYYVSWARTIPHMLEQIGLPFKTAYETALQMYNAKKKKS